MLNLENNYSLHDQPPANNKKGAGKFGALVLGILLSSSSLRADESSYTMNPIHPLSPLNPIHHGPNKENAPLSKDQGAQLLYFFGLFGLLSLGTGIYYYLSDRKDK